MWRQPGAAACSWLCAGRFLGTSWMRRHGGWRRCCGWAAPCTTLTTTPPRWTRWAQRHRQGIVDACVACAGVWVRASWTGCRGVSCPALKPRAVTGEAVRLLPAAALRWGGALCHHGAPCQDGAQRHGGALSCDGVLRPGALRALRRLCKIAELYAAPRLWNRTKRRACVRPCPTTDTRSCA